MSNTTSPVRDTRDKTEKLIKEKAICLRICQIGICPLESALESSVNDSVKLMNGELIMELQSHADTLQASKAEQTERIEKKQVAVEEAKERLNKLKRETEMLKVGTGYNDNNK